MSRKPHKVSFPRRTQSDRWARLRLLLFVTLAALFVLVAASYAVHAGDYNISYCNGHCYSRPWIGGSWAGLSIELEDSITGAGVPGADVTVFSTSSATFVLDDGSTVPCSTHALVDFSPDPYAYFASDTGTSGTDGVIYLGRGAPFDSDESDPEDMAADGMMTGKCEMTLRLPGIVDGYWDLDHSNGFTPGDGPVGGSVDVTFPVMSTVRLYKARFSWRSTLKTIELRSTPVTGLLVTTDAGDCLTDCVLQTAAEFFGDFSISLGPGKCPTYTDPISGDVYYFLRWQMESGETFGTCAINIDLKDSKPLRTATAHYQLDTAPTVAITRPSDGDVVSGMVDIIASASDDIGVTNVEFYIDGMFFANDPTAPYLTKWDTSGLLPNSTHTIYAVAYDTVFQSTESATVMVTTCCPPPDAAFSGWPTFGIEPLTVEFTDASTGTIDSWSWNFGDGSTSSLQNPTNIYATAGTYTVSLKVTGPGGDNTKTKVGYIVVSPLSPPDAAFSGSPTSGFVTLAVSFTDASTGTITTWFWDLGDGTTTSLRDPTHAYTAAGTYTVSLTVTGPGGSDTETKVGYIVVSSAPLPPPVVPPPVIPPPVVPPPVIPPPVVPPPVMPPPTGPFRSPLGGGNTTFLGVSCSVADALFGVLLAIAVLAFLIAAYLYLTNRQDEKRLRQAKRAFTVAIIGTVIALLSATFPLIIANLFDIAPGALPATCS